MRQYSLDIGNEAKLRAEIVALKRELAAVKQEKAHLEILLETIAEHPKTQVYPMQIEIDQNKRSRQVAEITQADYFQQLLADVERLDRF
jgi:glycine cleavage system regulatory protein